MRVVSAETELRILYDAADAEFARSRRIHGGRILCKIGCTDCCEQPFHISEPEVDRIRAYAGGLAPDVQERLRREASRYLSRRGRLLAEQGLAESRGSLLPAERRLPCPALEEGRCSIYPARPLICRRFGTPVWRPTEPGRLYACEKNFRPGEKIADPALRARQESLAVLREETEEAYRRSGARRSSEPLTVAHALCGP